MSCNKCSNKKCCGDCSLPNNEGPAYAFPLSSFVWTAEPVSCNGIVINTGDNLEEAFLTLMNKVCNVTNGIDGQDGQDGLSAYEIWLSLGNTGTEQDFIDSFEGQDGADGVNGADGLSAYDIWLGEGNVGTEQDFLDSLKGQDGVDGVNGAFNIEYISYSDLITLRNSSGLDVGTMYSITDNGVHLLALLNNQLATEGFRVMRIVKPEYYVPATGILGVWYAGLTPSAGDKVVWGGKVWENVAGNVGAFVDDLTLDSEWTLIPTSNNTYYQTKVFGCTYDLLNNWVASQWDDRGNHFKYDWYLNDATYAFSSNYIDYSDWGNNLIYNNICYFILNNSNGSSIYNNIVSEFIMNNSNTGTITFNRNSGISGNSNLGSITHNANKSIANNENSGNIEYNSNNGDITGIGSANDNIQYNTNNGDITTTTTGDISDPIVNK